MEQDKGCTPPSMLELPEFRRYFLEAKERLEALESEPRRRRGRGTALGPLAWRQEQLDGFLYRVEAALQGGICAGASRQTLAEHIKFALDLVLQLPLQGLSDARERVLEEIVKDAREAVHGEWNGAKVDAYIFELRLARRAPQGPVVSSPGRVFLGSPQRDALHWLLLLEVLQCVGVGDPWRASREELLPLVERPDWEQGFSEDEPSPQEFWAPLSATTYSRMRALGVLQWVNSENWTGYFVQPGIRSALQEIVKEEPTPFRILAETLLVAERDQLIASHHPGAVAPAPDAAVTALDRHARMVAHELRNAIIPVQHALQRLFGALDPTAADLPELRPRIVRGIERVLEFADRMARASALALLPPEPFPPKEAIEDAIAAMNGALAGRIELAMRAPEVQLRGHRERFVMSLVNLLRNAAQSGGGRDVSVRIVVDSAPQGALRIEVHDDGDGVPEAYRETIFQPAFSLRPGGLGQGLSLVRDVIEGEMGGKITIASSALGGACFGLTLPATPRRTP
ncbi:MAG: HAMP domain-containing histidine kinase [Deltaproteobacteria bacterium]|nr:HAMP domain-containing histidine kinase [Deltaproteobacteria bacterium]